MKQTLQRGWDQITAYLPLLLLAALALGTWWLVRNAPKPMAVGGTSVVSQEPDYYMTEFDVLQFDAQGRLLSEVTGEQGRHLPGSDTLEIDQLWTRSLGPDQVNTVASAQRGISNSDASEVQLWGNAKVTRSSPKAPELRFEGEFLHAWVNEQKVRSHLPVVLTRGGDRFTGNSLEYDNLAQVMELKGRVRGQLQPRP